MTARSLDPLLRPRSIAVVGASNEEGDVCRAGRALGGEIQAVNAVVGRSVPRRRPATSGQRPMGRGLQRSQEFRRIVDPAELAQRGAGGDRVLLRQYQRATADRTKSPTAGDRPTSDRRYRGFLAFLRADLHLASRYVRRVLGLEVLLQLLAPDHCDPEREYRRKRCNAAAGQLAPADRDAGTS